MNDSTTRDATRAALRAEAGMWERFDGKERIKQEAAQMARMPTMLTNAMNRLGPGTIVAYIGQEGELWWAELRLPEHHYSMTLVTACADTPDEALQNVVAKALTFAKEQEGAA